MKIDLSQFRETFLQESSEHIADIENGLLQLKVNPSDEETLHSVFRSAHSIKGGAGTFGLTEVVKFTHVLENLFDLMREQKVSVTSALITLLLRANDVLKALIGSRDGSAPPETEDVRSALEQASSASAIAEEHTSAAKGPTAGPAREPGETEYEIIFAPSPELFAVGSDPLLLLRNLTALGRITSIGVDQKKLPSLKDLVPETSYLGWNITLHTAAGREEIEEIFEFVLDCAVVQISEKTAQPAAGSNVEKTTGAGADTAIKSGMRANAEGSESGSAAARLNQTQRAAGKPAGGRSESASIRVPTEKIDKLIDLVGEMVIAHSITARLVEHFEAESLTSLQESVTSLERHIRELHERTMSVRMLPIGGLFSRFQRLIHDLANDTGKKLRLIVEGEDTEVDRSILELLSDPLTHVLRNSADHGIESPEVRVAAGKSAEGSILLRASHQAGNILVEIADDGAGLNLVRIREKAIDKGLISAESVLTDDQIRSLIFEPGFSTKEQVTNLSGRGVGMDVVRRNISALNGTIVMDSKSGEGTHIRIQLPLTLAIMEGLIVRVETHHFVIPLSSILETICLEAKNIHSIAGHGEVAMVREEALPFIRLNRIFGLTGSAEMGTAGTSTLAGDRHLIVVVEHSNQRAALQVAELLGQQQIVVKSLEKNFERLEGSLGATILGDGRAALILDALALMQRSGPADGGSGKSRLSLVA